MSHPDRIGLWRCLLSGCRIQIHTGVSIPGTFLAPAYWNGNLQYFIGTVYSVYSVVHGRGEEGVLSWSPTNITAESGIPLVFSALHVSPSPIVRMYSYFPEVPLFFPSNPVVASCVYNHVPTSSAGGTCLFSSVVERWSCKPEVLSSNLDGITPYFSLHLAPNKNPQFIICLSLPSNLPWTVICCVVVMGAWLSDGGRQL